MRCFRCGTIVDTEDVCPHCGSDIKTYRLILASSDLLYNRGLEQAQVRDLSGAIVSLKEALNYNKYNTKARNLLGLVYFEIGETVMALSEWVISKNLEPENESADKYLNEIQNTPGMLEQLNQTTKKYNQALVYCRQGSRDMASIQLRKVLRMNPRFVAGHQLLALLYIQEGKYNDARKELSAAGKIDVRNTTTLRYTKEVREKLKEQSQSKKKKKDEFVAFQDGNDTVMMPTGSFCDMLDSSKSSIANILTGLAIGTLICFFLVVPTVKQQAAQNAAATLVDTNEELSNSSSNVSQLKRKVQSLEGELEQYTGKADAVNSYEQLMAAKEAFDAQNSEAAKTAIDQINRELLSDKGKAQYDVIHEAVYTEMLVHLYEAANTAFQQEDYAAALDGYKQIIDVEETYGDGAALFRLAECQWKLSKRDEAIATYQKVISLYPEGTLVDEANKRLTEAGSTAGESGAQNQE